MIARLGRLLTRSRLQPHVGRIHARVLRRTRWRRSILLAGGQPVLALTTTGRRSGAQRSTVVAYVRRGEAYAVSGLNLAADHDPAWVLNLEANPRAQIDVAGERVTVRARRVGPGAEAEAIWAAFARQLPFVRAGLAILRRDPPLYVLEPSSRST